VKRIYHEGHYKVEVEIVAVVK